MLRIHACLSSHPSTFSLPQVEILNVSTGQQARFYYNGWLSKDEPPYQIEVELTVEGEDRPPPHRYTVTTYTSDIRGAGTDANVSVKIFGDKCESPLLPLANRCVCVVSYRDRVEGCQTGS